MSQSQMPASHHLTPIEAQHMDCCGPHHKSNVMNHMCVGEACMAWRWETPHRSVKQETPFVPTKGRCGYIPE